MRKLFKVILDCDDVLFDSSQKAVDDLNRVYGTSFKINDIKQWGLLGSILDERLKYFSNPEFIENLPLYPGAQDFVHELSKKAVYYDENVPLFRRNGYRKSGTMILRVRSRDTALN